MNKKTVLTICVTITITVILTSFFVSAAFAEQSGNSPESGVTSRIKQAYDTLVPLSYGEETAGTWGDWGVYWNRIYSAAIWTPGGTAEAEDVAEGETFYSGSRTELTGTANIALDYELQILNEFDDAFDGDFEGDEFTWTNTLPLTGSDEVWRDERTKLYWSHGLGTYTNIFPNQDHSTCDFFSSDPRGSYDGLDTDCGDAINACGTLELDADNDGTDETNWYLPTQKELHQAYLDGMFNQSRVGFVTTNVFWSSSEYAGGSGAWYASLDSGMFSAINKDTGSNVRCVTRD